MEIIITSSSFLGTDNPLGTTNSIYVIESDVEMNNRSLTIATGCTLRFRKGGSLNEGTLTMNNTKIEGSGYIFKENFTFGSGSTIYNDYLRAEWFNVIPEVHADCSSVMQTAISKCYRTNVRKLVFDRGVYNIKSEVTLANTQWTTSHTMIKIIGAGTGIRRGTSFHFIKNPDERSIAPKFIVSERFSTYQGGGFYDCLFYGESDKREAKGIDLVDVEDFTFYKCAFIDMEQFICVNDDCKRVKIKTCTFNGCYRGIKTAISQGSVVPISCIVEGCMFTECSESPLDLSGGGSSWQVIDTDFEGANGTIKLGSHNEMTNVRIERNLIAAKWLEVGSNCNIRAQFHADNADLDSKPWRCVIDGNNNTCRMAFRGLHPHAMISYGTDNFMDIVTSNGLYNNVAQFVYSATDTFIMNGYSNKQDYLGTNLISATYCPKNSSTQINCDDGICNPINGSCTINVTDLPKDYYKTCLFKVTGLSSSSESVVYLMNQFKMRACDRWLYYVCVYQPQGNHSTSMTLNLGTVTNTYNLYVRDVVVSAKPLYRRPFLHYRETETYNQRRSATDYHLYQTYLNYVEHYFCFSPSTEPTFLNSIGKKFYRNSSQQYVSGTDTILPSSACNGFPIVQTSAGYLNYVLQNMTDVDVELYDQYGNRLFMHAERASTSVAFDVTVTLQDGITYISTGQDGTIALQNMGLRVIAWIKSV